MPKTSERQQLLSELLGVISACALDEDEDDSSSLDEFDAENAFDTDMDDIADLYTLVSSHRYLSERAMPPKRRNFSMEDLFLLPDDNFRQLTRMSKPTFVFVLGEIEQHPIFHNESHNEQEQVWLQLAVALDRFGNYGNGVSLGRTLILWGYGKGTIPLYTSRVLVALKDLQNKYVTWPNAAKRKEMSKRMQVDGFKGCVGFIDGTTFPLAQKPALDGECYFDRKSRYSINAQVVCDDRRRIIAFYTGWPGSCADSTVYRNMQLADNRLKSQFFSSDEYLIADSAYPADRSHNTLVPAYKKNMKGNRNEDFNTCLAHVRVVNEHTIGVLKGRWSSLKELRIQMSKKEDMDRILDWISGCVVLHNMVTTFGDNWCSDDDSSSDEEPSHDEEEDCAEDLANDDDPFLFRRRLKMKAIEKGWRVGGILWHRANQLH